jgi:tetratricopeptide (TPR) repeat protein
MTRLARYRVGWGLVLLILSALALVVLRAFAFRPVAVLGLALLALIPGRLLGHFWRPIFRGRRALDSGQPEAAVGHFNAFLAALEARPWLQHLVWLEWPGYSSNPVAMAWTNLGAAHLQGLRLESARAALERALQIDPLTPLPWYNLGLLEARLGNAAAADRAFAEASHLGYRGGRLDQVHQALAGGLARVEGAGIGRGGLNSPGHG